MPDGQRKFFQTIFFKLRSYLKDFTKQGQKFKVEHVISSAESSRSKLRAPEVS